LRAIYSMLELENGESRDEGERVRLEALRRGQGSNCLQGGCAGKEGSVSIGLAVLIVLMTVAALCFHLWQASRATALMAADRPPEKPPEPLSNFELPRGYCFHPGHTWMAEQGRESARVGIDSLAAHLIGKAQRITVIREQRWVRQGQKLMAVTGDAETVELLSPLEGVVATINPEVLKDPELALRDPYGEGWVCIIKSPEMEINRRNLLQGSLAASWMQSGLQRMRKVLAQADPALAQDGGMPLAGALGKLSPELRRQVVNEFFVT
jgi:glycine cleavage system H lipoate-binding protein